jgi:hypothetical protein
MENLPLREATGSAGGVVPERDRICPSTVPNLVASPSAVCDSVPKSGFEKRAERSSGAEYTAKGFEDIVKASQEELRNEREVGARGLQLKQPIKCLVCKKKRTFPNVSALRKHTGTCHQSLRQHACRLQCSDCA